MKNTITRQNLVFTYDKNKNILIQSVKNYNDNTKKIHKATLDKKTIAAIKNCKNYNVVAKILRDNNIITSLKLDNEAKKSGIAKNTGYCTTRDNLINFLAMQKIGYKIPQRTVKQKKAKKAQAKKNFVNRLVAKSKKQ